MEVLSWLIRLQMLASHVVHAKLTVLATLSQRAISTLSTLISVLIVALAQLTAQLMLSFKTNYTYR